MLKYCVRNLIKWNKNYTISACGHSYCLQSKANGPFSCEKHRDTLGYKMHLVTIGLHGKSKYIYDPWVALNVKYIFFSDPWSIDQSMIGLISDWLVDRSWIKKNVLDIQYNPPPPTSVRGQNMFRPSNNNCPNSFEIPVSSGKGIKIKVLAWFRYWQPFFVLL